MIKFSLFGETILEWNDKDIEHYHARRMAMDSMLLQFRAKIIQKPATSFINISYETGSNSTITPSRMWRIRSQLAARVSS